MERESVRKDKGEEKRGTVGQETRRKWWEGVDGRAKKKKQKHRNNQTDEETGFGVQRGKDGREEKKKTEQSVTSWACVGSTNLRLTRTCAWN